MSLQRRAWRADAGRGQRRGRDGGRERGQVDAVPKRLRPQPEPVCAAHAIARHALLDEEGSELGRRHRPITLLLHHLGELLHGREAAFGLAFGCALQSFVGEAPRQARLLILVVADSPRTAVSCSPKQVGIYDEVRGRPERTSSTFDSREIVVGGCPHQRRGRSGLRLLLRRESVERSHVCEVGYACSPSPPAIVWRWSGWEDILAALAPLLVQHCRGAAPSQRPQRPRR